MRQVERHCGELRVEVRVLVNGPADSAFRQ
jgi:hypothetical protein